MRTKKSLPAHVKSAILDYAQNSDCTQKRIAELVGTSPRSVYRVLKEHGELKHLPRMTPEMVKAQAALKAFNLDPRDIPPFLENLHMLGVGVLRFTDNPDKFAVRIPHDAYQVPRSLIVKAIVEMEEGTWAALLKEVVTARVAKAHNVHVQTAMLNLSNEIDKHAKPGNQG